MRRDFGECNVERQQLRVYLESSILKIVKLQSLVMKQKLLVKLEQMAENERDRRKALENLGRDTEANVSSYNAVKELRKPLLESGPLASLLPVSNAFVPSMDETAEQGVSENYIQERNQWLHAMDRNSEQVETAILPTQLNTDWEESMKVSEAKRLEAANVIAGLMKKVNDLEAQNQRLEEERTASHQGYNHVDIHTSLKLGSLPDDFPAFSSVDPTPMKITTKTAIERAFDQQQPAFLDSVTDLDLSLIARREAVLVANLKKSEFEVEVLGDRVDEHKAVLDKVSLLLDCISTSDSSVVEMKNLAREISSQIRRFEAEQH